MSGEPWLAVEAPALLAAGGRFVEITYRMGFWDEPVRPLFRFEAADGTMTERIGPGPVAGSGLWTGRVPVGTVSLSLSPTSRVGPFAFRIEAIRTRSWPALLAEGCLRNPRSARSAVLTRAIGWRPEADNNLAWALGATDVAAYPRWRARRRRTLELDGLDAPRFDWTTAVPIVLVVDARNGAAGLEATLASLQGQVFTRWRAVVIGAVPLGAADGRIEQVDSTAAIRDGEGWIGALTPGDHLPPHALASVAETASRHPRCRLCYGDEEGSAAGDPPRFKPGWSPLLQRQRPYLGRAVFLRTPVPWTPAERDGFISGGHVPDPVLDGLEDGTVVAIRRMLLRARDPGASPSRPLAIPVAAEGSATIIIPTRDQAARLRRAIDSIRHRGAAGRADIIVVDNGSVEPEARRLLDELRLSTDARVIERPGPFNFSAMCNVGAAMARGDVLVFLNDDTEVRSPDWLAHLIHWALRPGIGAVGGKLTYPDGRIQHIGVLLGMGESAGHFGALAAAGAPGWAGRNAAVHEVSAVTGACLAIERRKFTAVGGFDALHLPIELSDIDLCLKLATRGWTALVDPAVHLLHEESASRGGATWRRLSVYDDQRALFKERWRAHLRDDPFFHPGLSLYGWNAALA